MPASKMSRPKSYFHHSSLNRIYPVKMGLPSHPARLSAVWACVPELKKKKIRTAFEYNIAGRRRFS